MVNDHAVITDYHLCGHRLEMVGKGSRDGGKNDEIGRKKKQNPVTERLAYGFVRSSFSVTYAE